ncbi:hypothetical protein ACQW02_04115 [Humitalea sp. 24SJ18S-53]|uniref:hypothetical protein n=1 Tax=Humitalea sp. 24SJ18S-53 TaxID=3422307 RepID=UPI003D67F113
MSEVDTADEAARWLAEAWTTGNPLAALPPGLAPRDTEAAEEIAAALLTSLGQPPVGLRLLAGMVGPLLAGRLIAGGTPIALAGLRHPVATAAVAGVLAAPLEEGATTPPVFASLHAAVDIAATRFGTPPTDPAQTIADLAGLGMVVLGPAMRVAPGDTPIALAPGRTRPAGIAHDLAGLFATAAAEARARGGLPVGAMLLVAGLSPPVTPVAGLRLTCAGGALGRARADFA